MRYEKKFKFNISDYREIKYFLLSKNFKLHFPDRQVSSIYYDTNEMDFFQESENGNCNRQKLRYRFYNYSNLDSILENKIKKGTLGYKKNLTQLKINESETIFFEKLNNKFEIKIPINIFNFYYPKVFIDYKRIYLISYDNQIRITLDINISSAKLSKILNKKFKLINFIPFKQCVLEIKFNNDCTPDDKFINKLSSNFKLDLTRNSKYCIAVKNQFK